MCCNWESGITSEFRTRGREIMSTDHCRNEHDNRPLVYMRQVDCKKVKEVSCTELGHLARPECPRHLHGDLELP
jgi:hypothetical protein